MPARRRSQPGQTRRHRRTRSALQRQVDPSTLPERPLHGVDDFLDRRAVVEVALIAVAAVLDLADEVGDQVGVEHRAPRLARVTAGREEAGRYLQLLELDGVRLRDLDRLGDAVLLDQPADDGAL